MKHHCKNHPNKIALSLCHSCGEYFCSDCLNEGLEYYYCNKDECNKKFQKELSQKKIVETKSTKLSKEYKFIRRIGILFIFISSIAFLYLSLIIYFNLMNAFDSLNISPNDIKLNIIGFYILKYFSLFLILFWIAVGFSLFASIKLYQLKQRGLFLYSLVSDFFLIVIYNIYIYSFLEYMRRGNIAGLGIEGYKNYWSIDKFYIAIISFLILISIIYLIKKLSSENIKQEFIKINA